MNYRFRLEGELLVLQVGEYTKTRYDYEGEWAWRDAKIGDIPVRDQFARDPVQEYQVSGVLKDFGA